MKFVCQYGAVHGEDDKAMLQVCQIPDLELC